MNLNITLVSIVILVIVLWIVMESKRCKHKVFAVFIIVMIFFAYFSFSIALNGRNLDLSTAKGIGQAGGVYLSWMASAFGNLKALTGNAINMNWSGPSYNNSNASYLNITNSSG